MGRFYERAGNIVNGVGLGSLDFGLWFLVLGFSVGAELRAL